MIVVLSLRGAADGLSLVVPHGDRTYYQARPTIAVPRGSLLAKDDTFGLHPALRPLLPMWKAGKLGAVHATGMRIPNRSHFAAMEVVEDADPGSAARLGWLNRLVGDHARHLPGPWAQRRVERHADLALRAGPVMAVTDLGKVQVAAPIPPRSPEGCAAARWAPRGAPRPPSWARARSALAASIELLPSLQQPDTSTTYPTSDLGQALAAVSRVLKADTGTSLVTVDQGDWDHHTGVGSVTYGRCSTTPRTSPTSIAAFFADLGPFADKVTLVTISEFGRRVVENAQRGLDHGWGNVMFLAGAGVKGGRYYGKWPELGRSLDADLEVTTDYRSVLAEVVAARTGASSPRCSRGSSASASASCEASSPLNSLIKGVSPISQNHCHPSPEDA